MIILPDNDLTVLPLPDIHAWQTAITQDHDTALLVRHLTNDTQLEEHDLVDKTYFKLCQQKTIQR